MANQLDNFERFIKESVEGHEVPFNPDHWSEMEKSLDGMGPKGGKGFPTKGFIAATITAAIITTGIIVYNNNTTEAPSQKPVAQQTSSDKGEGTTILKEETTHHKIETVTTPAEVDPTKIKEETTAANNTNNNNHSQSESTTTGNEGSSTSSETGTANNENSGSTTTEENAGNENTGNEGTTTTTTEILKPSAEFTLTANEVCEGSTVSFHLTDTNVPGDYLWDFGDGQVSKEATPAHEFNKAGEFIVSLSVRSKKDNSVVSRSSGQLITVHKKPDATFNWEMVSNNTIPSINFINTTDNAVRWDWSFGDGEHSMKKDPDHVFDKKGRYNVTLTATNTQNCSATISNEVVVNEDYNLLAPTAFSPNNDGDNDKFIPRALEVMNVDFRLMIFDQQKGLIFESNTIDKQWDGRIEKTGVLAEQGTYLWVVEIYDQFDNKKQYRGPITLIRN
jgi:gliding motility-associated-like protein